MGTKKTKNVVDKIFSQESAVTEVTRDDIYKLATQDHGFGKLPLPPVLMIDSASISTKGGKFNKGWAKAEFEIKKDAWWFAYHFVNDPVMPGCLGLDGMWQLLGLWLLHNRFQGLSRALGADSIKFSDQITPSVTRIFYQLDIKKNISAENFTIGVADGTISDGQRDFYTSRNLKVGTFKRSILTNKGT